MKRERFHGRHETVGRHCDAPGCPEAGEFRAPGTRPSGFNGPGEYRWFCLEHIRQFNAGYDFFKGMSADEIYAAQSPLHGWEAESRAFRPTAGIDSAPRWADFADPLDAIGARARDARRSRQADWESASRFNPEERRAMDVLGLPADADRTALRKRYSELLHRYHPDRNGGDRSKERLLQSVMAAYQLLRKAAAFA